jgi:hypothetical protein
MRFKKIFIFLVPIFTHHFCNAQMSLLDSCGIDLNPILNQYEITILDSLFFSSYQTKKHIKIDSKNGFKFKGKKIAFYSCTKNSNTKGNGVLSKKEFFSLCRPNFKGHAGRGIITLTEIEKIDSKGFDAVIIIDCPYDQINKRNLIMQLLKASD